MKFEFKLKIDEYLIVMESFIVNVYDYALCKNILCNIPKNAVLHIDNISMGGKYKTDYVNIMFSFSSKKNKHIDKEFHITKKFRIVIYDLNGLDYVTTLENDIDKITSVLLRKDRIKKILETDE